MEECLIGAKFTIERNKKTDWERGRNLGFFANPRFQVKVLLNQLLLILLTYMILEYVDDGKWDVAKMGQVP